MQDTVTVSRELLRQVLDETIRTYSMSKAYDALRAALDAPAVEPVAEVRAHMLSGYEDVLPRLVWLPDEHGAHPVVPIGTKLYAAPQAQQSAPVQEPSMGESNSSTEYPQKVVIEPVGYDTFIKDGRPYFSIGNQAFALDHLPTDEPDMTAGKQAEWMRKQLQHALDKLTAQQPRKAVKLSEDEVREVYNKWVAGLRDDTTFIDAFEQAVWEKLGVVE